MTLETWRPRLLRRYVGTSVLPGAGAQQLRAATDQSYHQDQENVGKKARWECHAVGDVLMLWMRLCPALEVDLAWCPPSARKRHMST
jgi:hypothetical protein